MDVLASTFRAEDERLMQRLVSHVLTSGAQGAPPWPDSDLLHPLREMLLEHRANNAPLLRLVTNALACACFGRHHLWQDLGAQGRDEVSRLLEVGFPVLFHGNVHGWRWKRYLFARLGERLGQPGLRPPRCDGCGDFEHCFGSRPVAEPAKTWSLKPVV